MAYFVVSVPGGTTWEVKQGRRQADGSVIFENGRRWTSEADLRVVECPVVDVRFMGLDGQVHEVKALQVGWAREGSGWHGTDHQGEVHSATFPADDLGVIAAWTTGGPELHPSD